MPQFPLMNKGDVNGPNTPAVLNWLKETCGPAVSMFTPQEYISWDPVYIYDITWNFEKFLIDSHGKPYKRYGPGVAPLNLTADIAHLLNNVE